MLYTIAVVLLVLWLLGFVDVETTDKLTGKNISESLASFVRCACHS